MAVMGRKKKAVAQSWNAINKQREKANKSEEQEKKEISPEEHEKRVEVLKRIGLIKTD